MPDVAPSTPNEKTTVQFAPVKDEEQPGVPRDQDQTSPRAPSTFPQPHFPKTTIGPFTPLQPQPRKIALSLTLVNGSVYYMRSAQIKDPHIVAIHDTLMKSGTLFITTLFCLLQNLNNAPRDMFVRNRVGIFAEVYSESFAQLPFLGEIELSKEEFDVVLKLFDEFYNDYNFVTLSSMKIKSRNYLQRDISEWFKARGVIMDAKKDFRREVLSAGLNDWKMHLQR
ncbi:uncharacterized protein LODBEIA_P22350 [Lodderomyces beijingensis]|uniref:Uncharacterized protein n=1 Tax=Lodderomyces beijingensis TaxID=1775926 RepID=A0ABP0ZMA5_9ASCO